MATHGKPPAVIDNESHPPTVQYRLPSGKKVKLLARGFPLNFDGGPENIPPDEIQLTRALMLIGAAQATRARVSGVQVLDNALQARLLSILEKFGYGEGDEEKTRLLEEAQRSLRLAENGGRRDRRHKPM